MTLRHTLLALTLGPASQLVQAHVHEDHLPLIAGRDTIPVVWVTVQSDGAARTITPDVHATETGVVTESAPPAYLTQTSAWQLMIGTATTTSTGLNPVATATGPGEAGAFLSCVNYEREFAPFCQPEAGSTLTSGDVYYITWDTGYFGGNVSVQVEGDFGNGVGFASDILDSNRGFYSWNVTAEVVQQVQENNSSLQVDLSIITISANDSITGRRQQGPTVVLFDANAEDSGSSKIGVLTVALPSLLGMTVLVVTAAICVINRKRRGSPSLPGWLAGVVRCVRGYGGRTQLPDRAAAVSPSIDKRDPQFDIQLTERDSWSATSLGREPHPGRNVFREEMVRQDRARR